MLSTSSKFLCALLTTTAAAIIIISTFTTSVSALKCWSVKQSKAIECQARAARACGDDKYGQPCKSISCRADVKKDKCEPTDKECCCATDLCNKGTALTCYNSDMESREEKCRPGYVCSYSSFGGGRSRCNELEHIKMDPDYHQNAACRDLQPNCWCNTNLCNKQPSIGTKRRLRKRPLKCYHSYGLGIGKEETCNDKKETCLAGEGCHADGNDIDDFAAFSDCKQRKDKCGSEDDGCCCDEDMCNSSTALGAYDFTRKFWLPAAIGIAVYLTCIRFY